MGWIRSKPVYAPLAWTASPGMHIVAGSGSRAADAITRLIATPPPGSIRRALTDVSAASAEGAQLFGCDTDLVTWLAEQLAESTVSTTVYLAGPEGFLWKCHAVARASGMARSAVRMDLTGSAARRVYCVHCKTVAERVQTTVHRCAGCGHSLWIRDHFSRLLGCYVGVRVDAESPGVVPEPELAFP